MTETELKKIIKNDELSGLYYFSGEETFLRDYYANEIKKKVLGDGMEEFNFHYYDDRTFSTDDIQNAMLSYPMMAERKMILFHDTGILTKPEVEKEFFAELFSGIPEYIVMVVCERDADKIYAPYKALKKHAVCVDFPYCSVDRLRPWLAKMAHSAKKSLSASDAKYLAEHCGPSMSNLRGEFQKVAAYVGSRAEITRKDIDACVTISDEFQIYILTDAVFLNRRETVYEVLKEFRLKSKENPALRVLSALGNYYADLLHAKLLVSEGATDAEIIEALSGPDFARKKALRCTSKVSEQHLRAAISGIKEADRRAKNGSLDEWTALETVIAQIMNMNC